MRRTYVLIKIIYSIKDSFFSYVFLMIACYCDYTLVLITEKLNLTVLINILIINYIIINIYIRSLISVEYSSKI